MQIFEGDPGPGSVSARCKYSITKYAIMPSWIRVPNLGNVGRACITSCEFEEVLIRLVLGVQGRVAIGFGKEAFECYAASVAILPSVAALEFFALPSNLSLTAGYCVGLHCEVHWMEMFGQG